MDAYGFWKRIDESNPFATLTRLADESGINYQRIKRNRSDIRLPSLEDAYLLSAHTGVSMEYLLTGQAPRTLCDDVYEYMEKELPSLLDDILNKINMKKGDGSCGNRA